MRNRKAQIDRIIQEHERFRREIEYKLSPEYEPSKKKKKRKKKKSALKKRKVKHWGSYGAYCKSEAFKIWKEAVLKKANYKCSLCGRPATIAHHINYRKWGTERVSDGVAVCVYHHNIYHFDKEVERQMKNQFN